MKWLNKVLRLKDLSRLYLEKAGEWLLLEILESDAHNNPVKMKLLIHSPDKDDLHDFLLDDHKWDWSKKYQIVLADPMKPCEINIE